MTDLGRAEIVEDETELRRYLLGELDPDEQVVVAERLFLDGEYAQLAQAVADELIDEYAHHDLTTDEREKFETYFLARPEHREDLRIAQALKRFLASEKEVVVPGRMLAAFPPAADYSDVARPAAADFPLFSLFRRRPVVGFSLAAAVVIILSVITWLSIESVRRQERQRQLQAQGPQPTQPQPANRQDQPGDYLPVNETKPGGGDKRVERHTPNRDAAQSVSSPSSREAPAGVAMFTILPGGPVRSEGQTTKVSVSSEVGTAILKLPLTAADNYNSYQATLQSDGRRIYSWLDLKSEVDEEFGRVVKVKVPARLLRQQSYKIRLSGLIAGRQAPEVIYSFQVDKK
jgi:anti-sigma factor RsiW